MNDNFDKKRLFAVFSFILGFILIAAFVFVYFNPKNETSIESLPETSHTSSIVSETSDYSDTSGMESEIELKVLAGEIASHDPKVLAEWYCRNMLSQYGTLSEISIKSKPPISVLGRFERFTVFLMLCEASFTSDNETHLNYVKIIFGSKKENPSYYYLIDGALAEEPSSQYDLKNSWDKIKKHNVFKRYAGKFKEDVYPDGITVLPLHKYIGENKAIYAYLPVSNNLIAIINSDSEFEKKDDYPSYKVDFINLNHPEQVISHPLDVGDAKFLFYHYSKFDDYLALYFNDNSSNKTIEYKIKIGTADTGEDITNISDYIEDNWYLYSESGRYYVFVDEGKLYLHDTVKNKDILVYKKSAGEDLYANPNFFIGDTLYYTVYKYNDAVCVGSYNPETKERKLYENGITAQFYANGYIYGPDSHRNFKRFSLKNPEKVNLLFTNDGYGSIFASPDEKYIFKFKQPNETVSILTIYYTEPYLTELKTFTFSSAFSSFSYGFVSGDKLFIPVYSTVYDSRAFIIDFNNLKP